MKEKLFELVRQIPKGKVSTYGALAERLGSKHLCRAVGNMLHTNTDPYDVPCHRVVNSRGKLAESYAFGGKDGQMKRLSEEGVEVINYTVDLKKFGIHHKE